MKSPPCVNLVVFTADVGVFSCEEIFHERFKKSTGRVLEGKIDP
jgi:hypothetical protein